MSIIVTAWSNCKNGKGHEEIKHVILKRLSDAALSEFMRYWTDNGECVLITRSRTDRQSPVERILWESPLANKE